MFLPFAEDWLHATNAVTAAQVAAVRDRILADGIPAQTFAAGANAIDGVSGTYNYNSFMANLESWPRFNRENGVKRLLWYHSDIKDIAYYFVYPLFEQLVSEGD